MTTDDEQVPMYIIALALKRGGIPKGIIHRAGDALAILMEDGRKVEFTAGEVFSAKMMQSQREYREKIELAKTAEQVKKARHPLPRPDAPTEQGE